MRHFVTSKGRNSPPDVEDGYPAGSVWTGSNLVQDTEFGPIFFKQNVIVAVYIIRN
jgi:hypothetical protein